MCAWYRRRLQTAPMSDSTTTILATGETTLICPWLTCGARSMRTRQSCSSLATSLETARGCRCVAAARSFMDRRRLTANRNSSNRCGVNSDMNSSNRTPVNVSACGNATAFRSNERATSLPRVECSRSTLLLAKSSFEIMSCPSVVSRHESFTAPSSGNGSSGALGQCCATVADVGLRLLLCPKYAPAPQPKVRTTAISKPHRRMQGRLSETVHLQIPARSRFRDNK